MNNPYFMQNLGQLSISQLVDVLEDDLLTEYVNNMTHLADLTEDEPFYIVVLSDTVLVCFDLVDLEGSIEEEEMQVLCQLQDNGQSETFQYEDLYKICRQLHMLGCQNIFNQFDL